MSPSDHFTRHEAECKFMAQLARDPESKKTWMAMAERWHRCAELAQQQGALRAKQPRHRKPIKSWSH